MYKNITEYDLDLIVLSQKKMLVQTKIASIIFSVVLFILAIPSFLLSKYTIGVALIVVGVLCLVLFLGLTDFIFRAQMKSKLKSRSIVIEYQFSNNLTITSRVDGAVTTQSFDYKDIFEVIEQDKCLVISLSKNDAVIMKKDDNFLEYRNFLMEKLADKYIVQTKQQRSKKLEK